MDIKLTDAEKSAIRSLKRLARNWPKSLVLFASGTLSVRKVDAEGAAFAERIVANIEGIPNDGGDGGDFSHNAEVSHGDRERQSDTHSTHNQP